MALSNQAARAAEYPCASLLRSSDRERILVQVMASVWDSILRLPLLLRAQPDGSEAAPGDLPLVVGTIRIAGAWDGVVAMTCPRTSAAQCTATCMTGGRRT